MGAQTASAGEGHHTTCKQTIEAMPRQCGGEREATEEQENDGMGKGRERLLYAHQTRQHRAQRHQQRGEGQWERLGQPQCADQHEDGQTSAQGVIGRTKDIDRQRD